MYKKQIVSILALVTQIQRKANTSLYFTYVRFKMGTRDSRCLCPFISKRTFHTTLHEYFTIRMFCLLQTKFITYLNK